MRDELEKLQGTWNIVTLEMDGSKMDADAFTGSKIIVKGARFTTVAMGATYEGRLKLDLTKTPKTIDLLFTEGPEKGNTSLAIYELNRDTWRMCLTLRGDQRPSKFATAPGSGLALETLRREKAWAKPSAEPGVSAAPPGEPIPELEGEWAMLACTRDGHPLDKSMMNSAKRVTRGHDTTLFFGQQVFMKAQITIDRSQAPTAIDYLLTYGQGSGKTQYGIYQIEGDTLKIGFSSPGDSRPADFTTTPGDGRTVTAWRRIKK